MNVHAEGLTNVIHCEKDLDLVERVDATLEKSSDGSQIGSRNAIQLAYAFGSYPLNKSS